MYHMFLERCNNQRNRGKIYYILILSSYFDLDVNKCIWAVTLTCFALVSFADLGIHWCFILLWVILKNKRLVPFVIYHPELVSEKW